MENFNDIQCPYPILKISQYPLPRQKVQKLVEECERIIVLEDGYPVVESSLKGFLGKSLNISGRLDGTVSRDGELNPNIVAKAIGKKIPDVKSVPGIVVARPPSLCSGCPHIDSYNALNEVLKIYGKGKVFSDIGCYTLAALPPFQSINSCVDMGASITMAKGAADAGLRPAIAVIGDSTFSHSGITGLLDAVNAKSPITVLILDNGTTGMTGGQDSSATGKIEQICEGIGVEPEHIRIINPLRKYDKENVEIYKEEFEYNGVSVIIPRRECIQTIGKHKKEKKVKETV
jgi:indolepyruvate ferredoxin oxidoreductase alpha subunit